MARWTVCPWIVCPWIVDFRADVLRRRTWIGQRVLVAAIRLYRARVSGRGPLRNVLCTFGRCESCSAYGLRIAERHATSFPHALILILGRLRRCRTSSVYRVGRGLRWGEAYDALEPVDDIAARVHETPATRLALLRAATSIARYRGRPLPPAQHPPARAPLRVAHDRARLPLRHGSGLLAREHARWRLRLLLPLGAALLGGLLLPVALATTGCVGALVIVVAATLRYTATRRRYLHQQRVAAARSDYNITVRPDSSH